MDWLFTYQTLTRRKSIFLDSSCYSSFLPRSSERKTTRQGKQGKKSSTVTKITPALHTLNHPLLHITYTEWDRWCLDSCRKLLAMGRQPSHGSFTEFWKKPIDWDSMTLFPGKETVPSRCMIQKTLKNPLWRNTSIKLATRVSSDSVSNTNQNATWLQYKIVACPKGQFFRYDMMALTQMLLLPPQQQHHRH